MCKKTVISLLISHMLFYFNREEGSMQTTKMIDCSCQCSGMKETLEKPH